MSGDLKERIEEMLAGLGDTADAVADSLRAKGIKGNSTDGECCPIANLLSAEFPEAANGNWGDKAGCWWVDLGGIRTPQGPIKPPGAVNEFISVFDDGVQAWDGECWETEHPYADLEYDVDNDGSGGAAEAARAEQ